MSEYSLNPLNLNSALAKQLTIKGTPSPQKNDKQKRKNSSPTLSDIKIKQIDFVKDACDSVIEPMMNLSLKENSIH